MASIVGNADTCRVSFACGSSLATTTSQYRVAYISASMTACLATNAADLAIGITDSYQSAGSDAVSVITTGLAKGIMRTGTASAIGDILVADAAGTLDVAITNTTDQNIIGRALDVPATGGAVTVYVNIQNTLTAP